MNQYQMPVLRTLPGHKLSLWQSHNAVQGMPPNEPHPLSDNLKHNT